MVKTTSSFANFAAGKAMENPFDHLEPELDALVKRFEQMLSNQNVQFFDSEEYEEIIDYYLERQNLERARKAIEMALDQYPSSPDFLLRKAKLLLLKRNGKKALELLDELEKIDPTNPEIYLTKGAIYSHLKQSEKAVEEYNRAIQYSDDLEVGV